MLKLCEPAPGMCRPPGPDQAPHVYLDALGSTSRLSGDVVQAGLATSATAQVWRCIACPDPLRPSFLGPVSLQLPRTSPQEGPATARWASASSIPHLQNERASRAVSMSREK